MRFGIICAKERKVLPMAIGTTGFVVEGGEAKMTVVPVGAILIFR